MLKKFALWYMPEIKQCEELKALIEGIANKCEADAFLPHMTGYSGLYERRDELIKEVRQVFSEIKPFEMQISGTHCSNRLFESFFIQLKPTEQLQQIAAQFGQMHCGNPNYQLNPHISLLYKEMSLEEKRALANETTIPWQKLYFDQVWVVSPGDPIRLWRNMTQLQIHYKYRLSS